MFLDEHGYVVIENVIPSDISKRLVNDYDKWWCRFGSDYPKHINSILHKYTVAHLPMTWEVRLLVKKVFARVWGTEKLLTSMDGIAISEPPEMGNVPFADKHRLHLDQCWNRPGLHAYQGSVYLNGQGEEDHCLQVLSHSHKHFKEFFEYQQKMNKRRFGDKFTLLNQPDVRWFMSQGCSHLRIPVSQGSVLLWDSRLVHDGAAPIEGRRNTTRWRHVTFVSMTPARWASEDDMKKKMDHYINLRTTRHWSAMKVSSFKTIRTEFDLKELPDIAKTKEARLMAGYERYNFQDGRSNGPSWTPVIL